VDDLEHASKLGGLLLAVTQVAEALGVAILMDGEPGTVHAPRAFGAFQELLQK
jgi:hypothetical protein